MSAFGSEPGPIADARQLEAWFAAALREGGTPGGTEATDVRVGADATGTAVVDVPAAGWVAAATCARDQLGMDFLDWLSAVDEPEGDPAGLDVVLHLAATDSFGTSSFGTSHRTVRRLLLRTRVPDTALELPSLTSLWPGVAWHERETFEMFGLTFTGFNDGTTAGLRPLLLPDGFEGTPLRKSFVLAARAAKAWPGAKDPGDSGAKAPSRRKTLPPGVPDPSWGPHEPGTPRQEPPAARPARAPRTAGATGSSPARAARAARAAAPPTSAPGTSIASTPPRTDAVDSTAAEPARASSDPAPSTPIGTEPAASPNPKAAPQAVPPAGPAATSPPTDSDAVPPADPAASSPSDPDAGSPTAPDAHPKAGPPADPAASSPPDPDAGLPTNPKATPPATPDADA